MSSNSQLEELKPNIARLELLGCQLTQVDDRGQSGYVASFRKADRVFSIVKDRGFWHLHGEDEKLAHSPSRKSPRLVEKDAITWLEEKEPIQPTAPNRRG